ncbi:RNA polymerase sigma factor [Streptomyces sp. NPDC088785]|uniref:RNA polymerase sigma factor n=1 Tax=Streptomyces sp. NPDC088785 TaxID=3365897 RepID=UPI0038163846
MDDMASERQMLARLVRGEAAALGQLYDRHARLVYAVAARLAGDEDVARSVVMCVFQDLWTRPQGFDPKRYRLRTWLVAQACEHALARAGGTSCGDGGPFTVAAGLGGVPGGSPTALELEGADRALAGMSATARGLLHLIWNSLLTYRQAADQLGLSEDEALDHVQNGLDLMVRCIGLPAGAHHV